MTTNAEYLATTLAPLKGYTFEGVIPNPEMGPDGVRLKFSKGGVAVEVAVWSDEEGNGSGFLVPVSVVGPAKLMAPLAKALHINEEGA